VEHSGAAVRRFRHLEQKIREKRELERIVLYKMSGQYSRVLLMGPILFLSLISHAHRTEFVWMGLVHLGAEGVRGVEGNTGIERVCV
jgi:hypothetical protein